MLRNAADELINQAITQRNAGRYPDAILTLTRAIEQEPTYDMALAYWQRGYTHSEYGISSSDLAAQFELAINDFTQVIALNPKLAGVYYARSGIYAKQAKYQLAIADLEKALALNPSNTTRANIYLHFSYIFNKLGEYSKAIDACNKALVFDNCLEGAFCNRAFALQQQGRFSLAIADYNMAIKYDPKLDTPYYYHRGLIYLKLQRMEEAFADFTKAVELNPTAKKLASLNDLLKGIQNKNFTISHLSRKDLFKAILKLSNEDQIPLLKGCLDKTTPLGKCMWKASIFSKASLHDGILKEISDHLATIDPTFKKPAVFAQPEIAPMTLFQRPISKEDHANYTRKHDDRDDQPSALGMYNLL